MTAFAPRKRAITPSAYVSKLLWRFSHAVVLSIICGGMAHASPLIDYASSRVRAQGDRLWVDARAAPLVEVLLAVAEAARFELLILGDLSVPTTVALHGATLDEAINTLTGDWSTIVIRASSTPKDPRPLRVWVFGGPNPTRTLGNVRIQTPAPVTAPAAPAPGPAELPAELADSRPAIRIAAIQQLYGFDPARAIPALGEILAADHDASVRAEALRTLTSIGGAAAFAALTAGLGDELPGLRRQTVRALVSVGPEQAVQYLGRVVFGDPDPALRLDAVELLSRAPHPAARALLVGATNDAHESVRQAARALLTTTTAY